MTDIQLQLTDIADKGETIVFTADQLTNEQYHANTSHISGSAIIKMMKNSLAGWKFADPEPEDEKSKALLFGTNAHTLMLEPERFAAGYCRSPSPDDYDKKLLITSVSGANGLQAWMKTRGIAGVSKSDPFELISIIRAVVEASQETDNPEVMPIFFHEIERDAKLAAGEREMIKGSDYDKITRMREVLLRNEQFNKIITGGSAEISIFTTLMGVPVKVRFDRVTDDAGLYDYKTTESAEPEKFKRKAWDYGYFVKMALQYHVFKKAYGVEPSVVGLIAQETTQAPFQALEFRLTHKARIIGTAQLKQLLMMYSAAKAADVWPSYNGGNAIDLDPPFYAEREYQHLLKEAGVN